MGVVPRVCSAQQWRAAGGIDPPKNRGLACGNRGHKPEGLC